MLDVYASEGRLLEQLALHGAMSISELSRQSGLSYPTTFYKIAVLPVVTVERVGREKHVGIKNEHVDIVYPLLAVFQTSSTKKIQLLLAYLARRGLRGVLVGGAVALQLQLHVRDADPEPGAELRVKEPRGFLDFLATLPHQKLLGDLKAYLRLRRDRYLAPYRRFGLLRLSAPEKILVDALAERSSRVFIEIVAEAIAHAPTQVDLKGLRRYAEKRGVLAETLQVLDDARRAGFP